jgi:hypothetical protein
MSPEAICAELICSSSAADRALSGRWCGPRRRSSPCGRARQRSTLTQGATDKGSDSHYRIQDGRRRHAAVTGSMRRMRRRTRREHVETVRSGCVMRSPFFQPGICLQSTLIHSRGCPLPHQRKETVTTTSGSERSPCGGSPRHRGLLPHSGRGDSAQPASNSRCGATMFQVK